MLLIDIINGLNFPGNDFDSVLAAAGHRKKYLNPLIRRVLDYAAKEPEAFQFRFSRSLLACAAYLLAKSNDGMFLSLVAPLIDAEAEPSLLGCYPEDTARMLADVIPSQLDILTRLVTTPGVPEHFQSDGFDAFVLAVHRDAKNRDPVVSTLRSILRKGILGTMSLRARHFFVESCCRIDPSDFVIDLQFAIEAGDLDEKSTNELIAEASQPYSSSVWFCDPSVNGPLTPRDGYLTQYRLTFSEAELRQNPDEVEPDSDALWLFNSVSVPRRDYLERFAALRATPQLVDVCTRVMRCVANAPGEYRSAHHPVAVSAAICLAAPTGDPAFASQFAKFLRGRLKNNFQIVLVLFMAITDKAGDANQRTIFEQPDEQRMGVHQADV
ncbi:MAG TPA: DUF1186 domain-containing protein, partial [Chthoniobacter sp.]